MDNIDRIPRPNGVPIGSWNAMTQDQQMAWYEPVHLAGADWRSPMKRLSQYIKGVLPIGWTQEIYEKLDEHNLAMFLQFCPVEVLEYLKKGAAQRPSDDDEEGWSRTVSVFGGTSIPTASDTPELLKAKQEDVAAGKNRFRKSIAFFRKHVCQQDPK